MVPPLSPQRLREGWREWENVDAEMQRPKLEADKLCLNELLVLRREGTLLEWLI